MYIVFIVLSVLVAILMIGIVLIQKSKGGGLSSQFGGGNQVLGVRGTNTFLEKGTWTLAALLLVLSVCSVYTMPKVGGEAKLRTEAAATSNPGNNFATEKATPNAGTPADAPAAAKTPAAQ